MRGSSRLGGAERPLASYGSNLGGGRAGDDQTQPSVRAVCVRVSADIGGSIRASLPASVAFGYPVRDRSCSIFRNCSSIHRCTRSVVGRCQRRAARRTAAAISARGLRPSMYETARNRPAPS